MTAGDFYFEMECTRISVGVNLSTSEGNTFFAQDDQSRPFIRELERALWGGFTWPHHMQVLEEHGCRLTHVFSKNPDSPPFYGLVQKEAFEKEEQARKRIVKERWYLSFGLWSLSFTNERPVWFVADFYHPARCKQDGH